MGSGGKIKLLGLQKVRMIKPYMQLSDQELIDKLRNGSTRDKAFSELVNKYQERLYWHIRKIVLNHEDSDDVLQNTFLKVWKNLDGFREESSLFTWLYRIAVNESLTFINTQKKRQTIPFQDVSEYLKNRLEADDYYEGTEIQKKLQQAILTLPEKQRLVFNMRYFDELPYQQMSEILETSVGALKASFHHAVKKVEEFISKLE
jgi:RNA polymerase sigma-70 factor, ECF subfamily